MTDNFLFKKKHIYWLSYILAWSGLVVLFYLCFSYDIWGDEAYSIKKSFLTTRQIVKIIAENDVHPPLYFIIIHVVNALSQIVGWEEVFTLKICSLIPYVIMLIWCVPIVRKWEGDYTAALFALCVVGMPQMAEMGITIRMYSWCALFVLGAMLQVYLIQRDDSKSNWIKLLLFSLSALYSHYFCAIAVAIIWSELFFGY